MVRPTGPSRPLEPLRLLEPSRLLDIGCGTGALLKSLNGISSIRSRDGSKTGCDISLSMLVRARDANGVKAGFCAADFETLPFRDSSFSLIASSLTYQWAADTGAAFREAWRVLRPGGLFFFSTLGPLTLNELCASYRDAFLKRDPGGTVRFMSFLEVKEIEEALGASGLEVIAVERKAEEKAYADAFELLKTLKGVGALRRAEDGIGGLKKAVILKEAARIYGERYASTRKAASSQGGVAATYDVIYASARKAWQGVEKQR